MKYTKTKYPNIYTYETTKGKRYYIRRSYKFQGKKREITRSGLRTLPEARAALTEIEKQIHDNKTFRKDLTVGEYWELYYKKRVSVNYWAPDTEDSVVRTYNNNFRERYGKVKLKNLRREEYEGYINSLLLKFRRSTVQHYHRTFMALLNDAVTCGYLEKNILRSIFIGDNNIDKNDKSVSVADFKTFDKVANKILPLYQYAMVRLTYLGLRKSEILGLQMDSPQERLDGRMELHIKNTRTYHKPKGNQKTKSRASKRIVVLDNETSLLMEKVIAETKRIAKKYNRILAPNDFLFISDYKYCHKDRLGTPVPLCHIDEIFKKIEEYSKIHITPHMMRHFFATQGVLSGISMEYMAAALGHSTKYMTDHYTHIQREASADVTASFMKIIS